MSKREGFMQSFVGLLGAAAFVGLMATVLTPEIRNRMHRPDATGGPAQSSSVAGPQAATQVDVTAADATNDTGKTTAATADPPDRGQALPVPFLDQQLLDRPQQASTPAIVDPKPVSEAADAAKPVESTPWTSVMDDPNEPPSFQEICFDDFDTSKVIPQQRDLRDWFDTVPGASGNISTARSRLGQCGAISGLLKLRCPWREDTALRLSLENYNQLRLHFFHAQQGVTLAYYESDQYRWAAYVTTRTGQASTPETFALTATDDGRNRRTEIRFGGPFEIRCRAGELILSRGDIILLRAPIAGLPEEVFFEGKSYFHGIELVRDRQFPPSPPLPPATMDYHKPAELNWEQQLTPKSNFVKNTDGSITLTADSADRRGWAVAPLPVDAVYETVLEISHASPGTGVFLRRADGSTHEFIRFVENRRDKSLCVMLRGNDDEHMADVGEVKERLVAHAAPRQWIRLLYGCGALRWWISSDGVHWAETHDSPLHTPGNVSHVGIHHVARRADCQITLSRLSFRRLDKLASLADAVTLDRTPKIVDAPDIGPWLVQASETVPGDVSMSAWRRACAVRSLASGCPRQLGHELVNRLVDEAVAAEWTAAAQLDLLDELTLLLSLRDDHGALSAWVTRYHEVGRREFERSDQLPYSLVRKRLLDLPFCERMNLRVASSELIRIELLQLLYASRWLQAVDFCKVLRFYEQHQQIPLVPWAEAMAYAQLPGQTPGPAAAIRRDQWRHPYEEQLSKRTYNVLAELQALLDGEAYEDAARTIASIDPTSVPGVAPISDDRKLLVSLPAAIRLSVSEYPELQRVLVEQFVPLAELRVQQAITAGDVEGVRLAAIQFDATSAAADAYQWLGDRAFSGGWFAQAVAQYQRAEKNASFGLTSGLQARIRLASALLGKDVGNPVNSDVRFGAIVMPAGEFESTVREMLERGSHSSSLSSPPPLAQPMPATLPPPSGFKAHTRSRLDGAVGERPNVETLSHVRRFLVPWVARQVSTVRAGNMLYLSNRFQVAAYDLNNGQRKWQSQNPPGKMLRSQDWSLTPMQPLVVDDRIYTRLLFEKGPMLVCLRKETGQLIWTANQQENEFLISDPLAIQNQLCVLSLDRTDANRQTVRLNIIAHDSGQMIRQENLLELRSSWWNRRYCRATALDDALVASFGGVTACVDLSGDLRWIRKQVDVPTGEDPNWVRQYFDRPRLAGGRLYLSEPSVRAIECVDPRTGQLSWSKTLPDLNRVISLDPDRLVIAVEQGLVAVNSRDGQVLWRKPMENLLDGTISSRDGTILISQKSPVVERPQQFVPQLTWISAEDGETISATQLDGLGESPDPRLGPLIEYQGRFWALFGRGHDDANRDFVELVPEGQVSSTMSEKQLGDTWTGHVPNSIQRPAIASFSPWSLIAGQGGNQTGLLESYHGESDVIAIRANSNSPAVLGRRWRIPSDGTPKLRLRVGHPPGGQWHLEIRAGERVLWQNDLEKAFPNQTWSDIEVDASEFRGDRIWLSIHGRGVNPAAEVITLWKRIELVN